jgi:hypothetical protein
MRHERRYVSERNQPVIECEIRDKQLLITCKESIDVWSY